MTPRAFVLSCCFAIAFAASDADGRRPADGNTERVRPIRHADRIADRRASCTVRAPSCGSIGFRPANGRKPTAAFSAATSSSAASQRADAGREIDVPHGLIHHWIGTILIPGVPVDRVVALMQGYERYQTIYAPNVRQSRTIARDGDHFTVYLQLFMKKVISVVLNTDNDVRYTRLDPSRTHVRSFTTRITELQDAGSSSEVALPAGRDSGFLWRFNNYCSLEERSEGTVVQCESISLSRGDPARTGVDRRPVRDEHPEGVARIHSRPDAVGAGRSPLSRTGVFRATVMDMLPSPSSAC